jgi:serine/threonine-protein kinase
MLPDGALMGLCPVCLLREGLGGEEPAWSETGRSASLTHRAGVLATLTEVLAPGEVPRVLLRDSDVGNGPGPVVQPGSPEMPAIGVRSERLQLLGEIARGGMGAVLKGRDPDLGRDLAIKVLLESHKSKPDLIRRFIEEAQIGGQLQHPGVVPIYELGAFADRRPYFAMKLVKGRTLASFLDERPDPARDLSRFLSIFESVCQTIAYAHARGVIHRDLKPSNIMVGSFGEVQVMDWGLAKVLPQGGAADDASAGKSRARDTVIATARSASDSDQSQAGSVLGTPSYMAPEQARGEVDRLDERCDVFALGSILCELLTGEPAFTGRSSGEIQRRASRGELEEALERLDTCGAEVELITLAKDCLASELEDRPRHAGEVAGRINAYQTSVQERLRQAEIAHAEEKARAEEANKRARVERDRLRLTVALAASIVALVILGGWGAAWLFQQRQTRLAGVEATLARIQAIRDQAAADGADPARWREALTAADQALGSIGDLAASEPGRRLAALRARIVEDQAQAERDRKLIDELAKLRASMGKLSWHIVPAAMHLRFSGAFKRYSLDLEAIPVKEVVARLKSRPEAVVHEVVGSLDHWLIFLRDDEVTEDGPEKMRRLIELAEGLDPDVERNRLRALLGQPDLKAHRRSLSAMASPAKVIAYGPSTALLLARSLEKAEDARSAIAVLRAAVVRYPGDVWTNFELARLLSSAQPPQPDETIRYYTAARALRPELGLDLAKELQRRGRNDEAEAMYRELVRRNAENPIMLFRFFDLLRDSGKLDEARSVAERITAPYRDQVQREPSSALARQRLGEFLWATGDPGGAIAAMREAIRLFPKDPDLHRSLGRMLSKQDDLPGVIAAYRDAIRSNQEDVDSHYGLASALWRTGDREGEIAELREAIRIESAPQKPNAQDVAVDYLNAYQFGFLYPGGAVGGKEEFEYWADFLEADMASAFVEGWLVGSFSRLGLDSPASERGYLALGNALAESDDLRGAIAAYSEAIRRGEGNSSGGKAALHCNLGSALRLAGNLPGAIASYREAIRLDPDGAREPRYGLGITLAESGDVSGAIAALREAVQRDEFHRSGSFRLLRAILMAQHPGEAIAVLRRVREQVGNDQSIAEAIDHAIGQFEQLSKLGVPIPRILRLSYQSGSLAGLCYELSLFAASAAIWSAGFATDSRLAEDMDAQNRYNAACSAALAGAGKGIDKPPLDERALARWRHHALGWLKADLAHWAKQAETGSPEAKALVSKTLRHWRVDNDLAGVREENGLKKLPEDERKARQAFWAEVAVLLKKASES